MRISLKRFPFIVTTVLLAGTSVGQVTTRSLLSEMYDLERLTRRPSPAYTAAQASSYDRLSIIPEEDNWFANTDRGNFVRTEERYGRTEQVMAHLKGPGAVVRIWSANPIGIIRFYFDGEEGPRIVSDFRLLMNGRIPPFRNAFAYEAAKGYNLYYPIPYQGSLKITIENPPTDPTLYYHIGYRTYEQKTKVESFLPNRVYSHWLDETERRLYKPVLPTDLRAQSGKALVSASNPLVVQIEGSQAIYELRAKIVLPELVGTLEWKDPRQPHNVLRTLLLKASFDGEECIAAPLGDFFGTAPGLNAFNGLPFSVQADGTMTCRFVMPFRKNAKISIEAVDQSVVDIELSTSYRSYKFTKESYLFHAQWIHDQEPARPFRDIALLSAKGEGYLVGDNLHIANPATEWWGEGDEKVFVDGERFPSTFGTGTEDFFGYAWGSTNLFNRPYHGQPNAPEPNNLGHSNVHRWHIFDPIPFRRSIDFSMEAESSNTLFAPTYAHTVYWYSRPGGAKPVPIDPAKLLPPMIPKS